VNGRPITLNSQGAHRDGRVIARDEATEVVRGEAAVSALDKLAVARTVCRPADSRTLGNWA